MTTSPARAGSGRRFLDRMVDASPDLLTVATADGVLRYVSAAARHLLGYEPESMVGRHMHEFLHPHDLAVFLRITDSSGPSASAVATVHRWLRADGVTVWLESLVQIVLDDEPYLVVSSRDVSARLETERRLLSAEQRGRRLADALDEGLVILDADCRILSVNRAGERVLGRLASQLVGRVATAAVALLDDEGDALAPDLRPGAIALRRGTEVQRRVRMQRPDGSLVWVDIRAVPLTPVLDPDTQQVAVLFREVPGSGLVDSSPPEDALLTSREIEVLVLMSHGLDPRRVAAALQISVHTARGHVKSILAKLGAHSQLEAVVIATRRGVLRPQQPSAGA